MRVIIIGESSIRWFIVSLIHRIVDSSYRWFIVSVIHRIVESSYPWAIVSGYIPWIYRSVCSQMYAIMCECRFCSYNIRTSSDHNGPIDRCTRLIITAGIIDLISETRAGSRWLVIEVTALPFKDVSCKALTLVIYIYT